MLKIEVETENAAFEEPGELARILRGVANVLEDATADGTIGAGSLRDINGNKVGSWSLT